MTDTRIVTTTYRYKPPPRKRGQVAAIAGSLIITIADRWRHRVS